MRARELVEVREVVGMSGGRRRDEPEDEDRRRGDRNRARLHRAKEIVEAEAGHDGKERKDRQEVAKADVDAGGHGEEQDRARGENRRKPLPPVFPSAPKEGPTADRQEDQEGDRSLDGQEDRKELPPARLPDLAEEDGRMAHGVVRRDQPAAPKEIPERH